MIFPYEKKLFSIDDSEKLAAELSQLFNQRDVIVINGDLGSGKTTIIKLICARFNIFDVSSPSFSIVNEYSGSKKVYHFDFYRIKKIEELYDIGFEDYLNDEEAITFIEWGSLMPEILPKEYYLIDLKQAPQNERIIKIVKKN
ncbi:MAG: tRNA (adenosine(37)-N6)-threonylcarbamoyltransferase complex ATPase subunit type 1 TsaE [Melioribacteraceae bacterium]|nr:tRNA (adenosine(37)-N6)-threonylcarbamoyltransferase complex ATPase subunit type 1 TsaE [Melioribacteraceae bacterium]